MRHGILVAVVALLLAACGGARVTPSPLPPTAMATNAATTATTGVTPTTPATTVATVARSSAAPSPTPLANASSTLSGTTAGTATPADTETSAIKAVIQRANQEQEQAIAARDATVMRDTATNAYYTQSAQDLNDLLGSGITAIHLVDLKWGPVTLQSATSAQATTSETWSTTYKDGSTLDSTDTNVYTLVLQGGAWKIQDDQHPSSRVQQPPGTSSASPAPAASAAPGARSRSRNWAGYAATGGTYTAVSGTWTVPTVDASVGPAADATWIGIGGVDTTDLIQAGTDATVQNGKVLYTAWVETLPHAAKTVPLDVSAGDRISAALAQQPDGSWQITLKNLTTNGTYKTSLTYKSSRSSAEWIEESPTAGRRTLLPLDNFGTVTFSGATTVVDGKEQTVAAAGGEAVTMYTASGGRGQALAQPSALGQDGASFSVTRTSAPAPRIAPRSG